MLLTLIYSLLSRRISIVVKKTKLVFIFKICALFYDNANLILIYFFSLKQTVRASKLHYLVFIQASHKSLFFPVRLCSEK